MEPVDQLGLLNTNESVCVVWSPIVTCDVFVPNFSCHASIVYVPGGRPLISYTPSGDVTAKNGCAMTPTHDVIQLCTSHLKRTMTSGIVNVCVAVVPLAGVL